MPKSIPPVRRRLLLPIPLLLVGLVTGCYGALAPQDLTKVFADKKIPAHLAAMQTQVREIKLRDRERIVRRMGEESSRTDLLRVGIIDSGVDLAHPDLIDRIEYRVKDARIVGAGVDLLGKSGFGSQMLINPTLFAFGAKMVKDGKLYGALESPLALLEEINNFVVGSVLSAIAADPLLKAQYFGALHHDSFTVFGLYGLYAELESYMNAYAKAAAKNTLQDWSKPRDPKDPPMTLRESSTSMSRKENLPFKLAYTPHTVLHADRFFTIVKKVMDEAESRYQLGKNIEQVHRFSGADRSSSLDQGLDILRNAMLFVKWGPKAMDPLEILKSDLESAEPFFGKPLKDGLRILTDKLKAAIKEMSGNPKLDAEKIKTLEKQKSELTRLEQVAEMIDRLGTDPAAKRTYESRLRRYAYRSLHPYIAPETLENSHGSHVAGTVARQHPNIRIVPIRVTTQSIRLTPSEKTEIVDTFTADFKQWLATDMGRALRDEVIAEYRLNSLADSTVLREVRKYLESNPLNAVFVRDILDAVSFTGREKIKIANVSLGTVLKKKVKLTDKIPSVAEDLFAEFARVRIGETIEKDAGKTLFLVATGNDGDWIDGVSKTGFPVGITSLRAIRAANRLGLHAPPNNRLKNVLAVGSVSKTGTLSVFTNILIDPNTPQVYSTGEEIMAPVPARTETTTQALAAEKLRPLEEMIESFNELYTEHVVTTKPGDALAQVEARLLVPPPLQKISGLIGQILHLSGNVTRERKSGTSMATPTATGIGSELIIEKMAALGIKSADVYDHPAFAPETLIAGLKSLAQPMGKGQSIQLDVLLEKIRGWRESNGTIASRAQLKKSFPDPRSARALRCEALFSGRAAAAAN